MTQNGSEGKRAQRGCGHVPLVIVSCVGVWGQRAAMGGRPQSVFEFYEHPEGSADENFSGSEGRSSPNHENVSLPDSDNIQNLDHVSFIRFGELQWADAQIRIFGLIRYPERD